MQCACVVVYQSMAAEQKDLVAGIKSSVRKALLDQTEQFHGYLTDGCNSKRLTYAECLGVFAQPSWGAVEEMLEEVCRQRCRKNPEDLLAEFGKKRFKLVTMKRFAFKRRGSKFTRQKWLAILQQLYSDPDALRFVPSKALDVLPLIEQGMLQPKPAVVWAPVSDWDQFAEGYESLEDVSRLFDRALGV